MTEKHKQDLESLKFSMGILTDSIDFYIQQPDKVNFSELCEDFARTLFFIRRVKDMFDKTDLEEDILLFDSLFNPITNILKQVANEVA